ncbi:MAG: hypothetical protein N3G20_07845 [Verrucomicrobiae bacterium]|nr:hypothetical protein [Verrucomicrobiae bacterium]
MTPRMPDNLNRAFTENIRFDEIAVYNGSLTIAGSATAIPNATCAFDTPVLFPKAFYYDLTRDNLCRTSGTIPAALTARKTVCPQKMMLRRECVARMQGPRRE